MSSYQNVPLSKSVLVTLLILSIFTHSLYKPLPNDFPQPWKYRFLCFGADLMAFIGDFLETLNISHRVSLIRLSYYVTVGLINIRDQNDGIEINDEIIDNVKIRTYMPLNSTRINKYDRIPTIFYYHGGGFLLGNADIMEPITYLLSKHTQCLVIYIEYRLIPEHKFPAALIDSLETTKTIIKNHKKYKIDLENIILIGDSAGGNLATVINRKLIEENLIRAKLKILIYPVLQFFDFTLPSYRENLPKRILGNIDKENLKHFIHYFTGYEVDDSLLENGHLNSNDKESILSKYVNRHYIPDKYVKNMRINFQKKNFRNSTLTKELKNIILHPDVSPLLVDDLYLKEFNALNTYVLTVGHDILRDDGLIYVERLKRLNISVSHDHYEHLFHGIFGLLHGPLKFDYSHVLMTKITDHINYIIDN